ncbi:MAG TPA: citrate/2-methylcitrate synthase [Gemmatimonadales bacterium]|nr:citrate/2-methylcitrate synthase [Gemmatimonadales bacterium]
MTSPVGSAAFPTPQLDGVVATQSSICLLSAEDNRLAYRGYDVAELAEKASYEETAYLLLAGKLPTRHELVRFVQELRARHKLPRRVQRVLRDAGPGADPMSLLRTAVSASGLEPVTPAADIPIPAAALDLMALMPTLVAAVYRTGRGERTLTPRRSLGLAGNLLFLLTGEKPARELARSVEIGLSLRADNELNPSTFAARVAAATKADLHGCITAALAALAGPLHGGHALAVYRLLEEIGSADRVAQVVDGRLATGKSFPGFGHPVYRGEDPRTAAMQRAAETAAGLAGDRTWLDLAMAVENRVRAATGKHPNVDFYLAPLYRAAGIPPELFSAIFAVARIPGWLAHVLEQQRQEGLIRPRAAYVGPARQEYVPIRRR